MKFKIAVKLILCFHGGCYFSFVEIVISALFLSLPKFKGLLGYAGHRLHQCTKFRGGVWLEDVLFFIIVVGHCSSAHLLSKSCDDIKTKEVLYQIPLYLLLVCLPTPLHF